MWRRQRHPGWRILRRWRPGRCHGSPCRQRIEPLHGSRGLQHDVGDARDSPGGVGVIRGAGAKSFLQHRREGRAVALSVWHVGNGFDPLSRGKLPHAMPLARGMDIALADKSIGIYVNDYTRDYGDAGRLAIRGFLGRGHAGADCRSRRPETSRLAQLQSVGRLEQEHRKRRRPYFRVRTVTDQKTHRP